MESILDWRKFSLSKGVQLQNAEKRFLPRVSVPKAKMKGYSAPKSIKRTSSTGKFGSDTLLYRPELRERVEITPCSYLEASLKYAASKSATKIKNT